MLTVSQWIHLGPQRSMCCAQSLGHVWLFCDTLDCVHQAPLFMGFSRQEYWNGLPFPSPGDLSYPGIKWVSPSWQVDSFPLSHLGRPKKEYSRLKFGIWGTLNKEVIFKGIRKVLCQQDRKEWYSSAGSVTVGRTTLALGHKSRERTWLLEPGGMEMLRGRGPSEEEMPSSVRECSHMMGSPTTLWGSGGMNNTFTAFSCLPQTPRW